MNEERFVTIDRRNVAIGNEQNLLELIRKAGVDLPTFCYHSELSVYGACRLCMVDVEGLGLVPACSTPPSDGMKVNTNTEEARNMRKVIVELLLANHSESCPTCQKSTTCQLQALARRLGISKVRFKKQQRDMPIDISSPSITRDPNKCVLCGDCVRICSEVQTVGAIDFAYRGAQTMVVPSFGKDLDRVECVNCGQCARICPTGALTPRSEVEEVWKDLHDPTKFVVAQVAPAVRVALGEMFGLEPGVTTTGQIGAALKVIGFDRPSIHPSPPTSRSSRRATSSSSALRRGSVCRNSPPAARRGSSSPSSTTQSSSANSPRAARRNRCSAPFRRSTSPAPSAYGGRTSRWSPLCLHREEVRGEKARIHGQRRRRRGPRAHHAGTGLHDPRGGPQLQGA